MEVYRWNTHPCPGYRLHRRSQLGMCRWHGRSVGWCHTLHLHCRGYWHRHHPGGTRDLRSECRIFQHQSSEIMGEINSVCVCVGNCTSLSHGTFAEKWCHTVMTRSSIKAHSSGTVIDILTAIVACPAVHAHTRVATIGVEARATIMTGIWLHQALVNILSTVLTLKHKHTGWAQNKKHPRYSIHRFYCVLNVKYLSIQVDTGSCRCSLHLHKCHHSCTCGQGSHPHSPHS